MGIRTYEDFISLRPRLDLKHMWSSLQDSPVEGNDHKWPNLPPDLMVLIMQRCDVLTNVKKVCKYWYILSKDPSIPRVVEYREYVLIKKLREKKVPLDVDKALHKMVMDVIDLSRGQLPELCINFGSDNLFKYIYRRSKQLRRLRLEECCVWCYDYESYDYNRDITLKGMVEMLKNLPLLEELELPYTNILGEGIEIVGRHCLSLKSFTLNERICDCCFTPRCDKQALAIAKRMPGLRRLELFGNRMTITGLMAILDNCHHLEYLDLRQCYGLWKILKDEPDFERELRQQIKHVRFPGDSTKDSDIDDYIYDSDG